MFNRGFLTKVAYGGGYLKNLFFSTLTDRTPPCATKIDFYYSGKDITTSEIADEIDGNYILEITDNLGVKLPDGAQPIATNYIKFKENYPTLVSNDTTNVFFDIGGQAKVLLIGDLLTIYNDQYFFEFDELGSIIAMGIYKENMSVYPDCLDAIEQWFRTVQELRDENELFLTDNNDDTLLGI